MSMYKVKRDKYTKSLNALLKKLTNDKEFGDAFSKSQGWKPIKNSNQKQNQSKPKHKKNNQKKDLKNE